MSFLTNIGSGNLTLTSKTSSTSILGGNSNPEFARYPDVLYMCVGIAKTLDFSCSDADGDSLVYSLINPYNSGSPSPTSSRGKPFTLASWNLGFNTFNYLGPGTNCTINSSTGIVTARPAQLGKYQIAVLCEECRNRVKIGETYRDIPVPAINCALLSVKKTGLKTSVKLFPNPSNGNFTLSIDDYNSSTFDMSIIDVTGKVVHTEAITSSQQSFDLSQLPKGIYFMKLSNGENLTVKRIVIQ